MFSRTTWYPEQHVALHPPLLWIVCHNFWWITGRHGTRYVLLFFSLSHLLILSSPFLLLLPPISINTVLTFIIVTQIRGSIAGSSPPSPLRHVPCIFISRQEFSPFFTRRFASNCAFTHARLSAVDSFFLQVHHLPLPWNPIISR